MRELWVAQTRRGVSTWLHVSIVALLAVKCVNSNPTITCPSDKTGNTDRGASTKSLTLTTPTAAGNNANVQCDRPSPSVFSIGTTDVTCTATDGDGNKATCVYYVIITDNEDPTISNLPADIRATIPLEDLKFPNSGAVATWQAPATIDNSNLVTLSSTHEPGEMFPIGDTTVTYTATDRAGNTARDSFHVRVLVKPPEDDIFVDGLIIEDNLACLTLFWPETGDQETESYGLFFWREGDPRPSTEQRKIQTADNSQTYIKYDQCGLITGELYNVDVQKEPALVVVGSLQFWTRPKQIMFLSPATVNGVATVNNTFVDVSWKLSSDNVDQYLLRIDGYEYREYFTKNTDHTRLEGFRPGFRFSLKLSAVVGSADRREEGVINQIFLQIAQPGQDELIVYNYTESTIAVAWGVADNINDQQFNASEPFMVFINPKGTGDSFQIISGSPLIAEFTGLEPNTNYEIQLIHNVLQSSLTTTQTTRPVRATNVRPTDVQSSSITLEWEPSTEGVTYELYISPGEGSEPIVVPDTRHSFNQLKYATEYFIKIVSVYNGMKSVPQTLLVTAGVTKPTVPSSAFTTLVIVGSVLGGLALVLAVVILVACIRLRRLRKDLPQDVGKAGHTNKGMDLRKTSRRVEDNQPPAYDVPGNPGDITHRTPPSASEKHAYENSMVARRNKIAK